jgi:hypothetical protein
VVLAKNQMLPRLVRRRILSGRCWAGLPEGLEAGAARLTVAETMGDGRWAMVVWMSYGPVSINDVANIPLAAIQAKK